MALGKKDEKGAFHRKYILMHSYLPGVKMCKCPEVNIAQFALSSIEFYLSNTLKVSQDSSKENRGDLLKAFSLSLMLFSHSSPVPCRLGPPNVSQVERNSCSARLSLSAITLTGSPPPRRISSLIL